MKPEFLHELFGTIVYVLPVLVLVWKLSSCVSRLEVTESKIVDLYKAIKDTQDKAEADKQLLQNKIEEDKKAFQSKMEEERLATDSSISTVMNTLVEIQKSVVRIETKLDLKEEQ